MRSRNEVAVDLPEVSSEAETQPAKSWSVYLVRCGDDSLYTGVTNDIDRRIEKHNAGTASRYTRGRLPVILVYEEIQASRSLALKREYAIKGLSRREKESLIRRKINPTQRVETR